MAISSDFEWDLERTERTIEVMSIYDVQKAKQIIHDAPREVHVIDLGQHGPTFRDYLEGVKLKPEADWAAVNTDVPVIFGQTPEGRFPIDGRHRLAKALTEAQASINGIYLTQEETAAIWAI